MLLSDAENACADSEAVGVADSCKDSTRNSERGMFSIETIKRGRNERMTLKGARVGLTTPFGEVGLLVGRSTSMLAVVALALTSPLHDVFGLLMSG